MANLDINDPIGITDTRRGRGTTGTAHTLAEIANTTTVGGLRARLTALDGTAFTAARLDAMTENDMLYALRLRSADSAGIK